MKKKGLIYKIIHCLSQGDRYVYIAVICLMISGSVMVLFSEMGQTGTSGMTMLRNFGKQGIYWGMAFIAFCFGALSFTFKRFKKVQIGLFLILVVLMVLPFCFDASGGSYAWIRFGGFSLQPSEFLKPFMILSVANAIYRTKKKKKMVEKPLRMFAWTLIFFVVFAVELLAQRDLGTLAILTMTYYACLMIPDYPAMKKFQRCTAVLLFSGGIAVVLLFGVTDIGIKKIDKIDEDLLDKLHLSHVVTRIQNMKNPLNSIYSGSYQPANSLYAIGNSNVIGRGPGNSTRKYGFLTQAENDYILAVILEETGIFGLAWIVFWYGILIWQLFFYATKTNDLGNKVILGGTATYISVHFILNVGGVACLIPFTGVPLLFISSGGSSLMSVCLSLGIAQNCIRKIKNREM